jgi:uncharacterized protein
MYPEQTDPHEAGLVPRLLCRLVGGVCRCPRLVLLLALACCGLSVYGAATHLQYHTQRSDLISPRKECQQLWRQYVEEFGDDDDIVVVVQGSDRKQMERALESLAGKVRGRPDLFDRLFYKVNLQPLRNRALLYLPSEEIKTIQENIKSMGLLLEFAPLSWQNLSLLSLVREARHRAAQIEPNKPLSPADDQFLTQLVAISRSATALLGNPAHYKNPWGSLLSRPPEQEDLLAEPQYFFSTKKGEEKNGTLAFLLARPAKEAGSFTAAERSVEGMRSIVETCRADFPHIEFGLTGLPVLETDEMVAAQRDTGLASWLAIAGVSLLFLVVYRSIYYPLLTVATLLTGTAWAMGWLTLTVGHLNILSATFAVMLIGMGDYGVLWVMRYEQARRLGMGVREALLHTTTHVAVGNLTAAATLALAFFAAMLADFQAVAELGWIAGCGVLLCALACFTLLPALLMVFDRRPQPIAATIPISTEAGWLPRLTRRPAWVIAAGLAVTALLAAFCSRVWYDHNLLHLQASDLDSVKWEMTLIEHTAGASWHALSYTSSPEEALALKARYEQLPEVSRVVEVASLVPRDQPAKIELLRDIRWRLRKLPERGAVIPHTPPDSGELQNELTGLIGQLGPLTERHQQTLLIDLRGALSTLDDKITEVRQALLADLTKYESMARGKPLADPKDSAAADPISRLLQIFDERLAGDLAEDLHRLRDVCTPAPIVVADLPPELRDRYIGKTGKWLVSAFAKDCLWDFKPLEHFSEQIQTVDPDATGKPFATVEGLRAMKGGFQWAGVYALLAIIAVLALDFRNVKNTLIALTPLAMGVVLSLGILGLFHLPLNPANMIAFPLILGVGIDNGVHVLHDYLIRRREGHGTISHPIGRGVLTKALTTMIGFGALMVSTQRGLVGLGFILTLGVGCCMVTSLLFLPAVLRAMTRRRVLRASKATMLTRRQAA